jgi:hypothetical protein
MPLLEKFQASNCIIGSAVGKECAQLVLDSKFDIKEAIDLISHQDKNIRSGAAKTIEKVAEKKPVIVAPHLDSVLKALDNPEAQTRWMMINTLGLCAKLNQKIASKALDKATQFLHAKNSGACLWDRTICYLGYIGATSKDNLKKVIPLLDYSLLHITSQTKTVLEAYEKIISLGDEKLKQKILATAIKYQNDEKNSVKSKASKLIKKLS